MGFYKPSLTKVTSDIVASQSSTEGVNISTISGIIISHPNSTLIDFKSFYIIIKGTPNSQELHHGFPILYLSTVLSGQIQVPSSYRSRLAAQL